MTDKRKKFDIEYEHLMTVLFLRHEEEQRDKVMDWIIGGVVISAVLLACVLVFLEECGVIQP
jgi:heme/copper-type cytochrome/quinol oxidase subunit 4